ncbi:MAG: hypothetical protein KKG47_02270 [Proteobacteria bacterium]|nr:hypothetical protein [Pseudomonadota bacterium]MBU1737404.1 hypothetical protein [Pseudomonadota bacterium]
MSNPFLIAETPRGGPYGHRFIIPPGTDLQSSEVEAYFQRAALGRGNDFIAVNHQVTQHLPNGAVRKGSETLLLAGVPCENLSPGQMEKVRQTLRGQLDDLEKLVTGDINWEEAGQQTLIIRAELAVWLRKDINALAEAVTSDNPGTSRPGLYFPKSPLSAVLIGSFLGIAVGAMALYLWFF